MSKRKRDPIFAASEKMALIDLIEKYFDIVESKKTDVASTRKKNEEWQKIAAEFNAISSIHPRDWTVLKNCWENLKKRAKQTNTLRNQHFLATGGGPAKKVIEDPATERVLGLIRARVTGFINSFDSDGTLILASSSHAHCWTENINEPEPTQRMECTNEPSINPNIGEHPEVAIETPITVGWSYYTPNMLREAPNEALRSRSPSPGIQEPINIEQPHQGQRSPPRAQGITTRRRRPTLRQDVQQSLTAERIKTLLITNTHAEEEHALQMSILRLQEEKEKEIVEQEKLKTEQEKIKLEILKIQLQKLKDSNYRVVLL